VTLTFRRYFRHTPRLSKFIILKDDEVEFIEAEDLDETELNEMEGLIVLANEF
jgi:hypothetical protein